MKPVTFIPNPNPTQGGEVHSSMYFPELKELRVLTQEGVKTKTVEVTPNVSPEGFDQWLECERMQRAWDRLKASRAA